MSEQTPKYVTDILAMIVRPETDSIFSEMATRIEIEDEAAGCFVVVKQDHRDHGKVSFDEKEWLQIRAAIDEMFVVAKRINAQVEADK